jgi:xanthine dehydrogenase YagS FAD-binding subunit
MNPINTLEYRAGGTDLHARLRRGLVTASIMDVPRASDLSQIQWNPDGSATLGALVAIDTIARDSRLNQTYSALALAANGLATPQIRRVGTIGGNLLQRTRCPYYRHPSLSCYKKGGDDCPARTGENSNGVIFDLSPCVYPHPSTLGMALLVYDADVTIEGQGRRSVASLYGDGSDPTRDHLLHSSDLLTHVHLPPPIAERAAYFRAISRAEAEWPLVECVVRLGIEADIIRWARVAVGGVAVIPLPLPAVEDALLGQAVTAERLTYAASFASHGSSSLLQTAYKIKLLRETVLETLERALP